MRKQCTPEQLQFHALGRREVIGRFDARRITRDGGGLLYVFGLARNPRLVRTVDKELEEAEGASAYRAGQAVGS